MGRGGDGQGKTTAENADGGAEGLSGLLGDGRIVVAAALAGGTLLP